MGRHDSNCRFSDASQLQHRACIPCTAWLTRRCGAHTGDTSHVSHATTTKGRIYQLSVEHGMSRTLMPDNPLSPFTGAPPWPWKPGRRWVGSKSLPAGNGQVCNILGSPEVANLCMYEAGLIYIGTEVLQHSTLITRWKPVRLLRLPAPAQVTNKQGSSGPFAFLSAPGASLVKPQCMLLRNLGSALKTSVRTEGW
jgi:hypothetical protein